MTNEERIIREACEEAEIRSRAQLAELTHINKQTLRLKLRFPDKMTLRELRAIVWAAKMTDNQIVEVIRDWFV